MSRTTTKIIIARQDGTVVGQYFLGQGEHVIGRQIDSAIYIADTSISHEHARLIISADAIEIEDLNSTTGTFVDGITVRGRIPLQPGQKLWISDLYIDIERQGFGGLIEGSRLGDGRFTLKRELGKGGMGAVWLALDEDVHENVALTLVSDGVTMDPKGLKDLQREVNKAHQLVHPNIVRVGYFWKEEGEPAFISLEYVDGTDLDRIRSQTTHGLLAWEEVQAYMLQLFDALEYAHSQKVAHRDIKPANFMINSEGNLKLADFGIAATLADTIATLTSNTVLGSGTPLYMSPQQMDGKRPQVTDDIYSVGATLYELLTSKPPFYRGDIGHQIRHAEVTPMVERLKEMNLANNIPEYVNTIVMSCLQKDAGKRPQSMGVIREWITSGVEVAQARTIPPASAQETQVLKVAPPPSDYPNELSSPTRATTTTKKAPAGGTRGKRSYGMRVAAYVIIIALALFYDMRVAAYAIIIALAIFVLIKLEWIKERIRIANLGGTLRSHPDVILPNNNQTGDNPHMEKVKELHLVNKQLTGVKGLEKLTKLTYLNLHNNQLTSVKGLEKLTQLQTLNLFNNQLTDIKGLEKLTQLELLFLRRNPALTKAQIDELQKVLPKCKIYHNATK